MDFRFISRYRWGALDPRMELEPLPGPVTDVMLMDVSERPCSNTRQCIFTMRYIQSNDINKLWRRDIRFNFMIGGDGVVYEGRGWGKRPIIPERFRKLQPSSLAIGFIGKVDYEDLPENMSSAYKHIIDYGLRKSHISPDFKLHTLFTSILSATSGMRPFDS